MTDDIFASEAPKYWERELPVVPIEPGTKRPPLEMKGWQGNLGALPSVQKRAAWIDQYGNHGIGILLGATVDTKLLYALDVDDDRLLRPVLYLLGFRLADQMDMLTGKRGKKGATLFVRGAKSLKSAVIKGAAGLGNIDFLGAR